jgi:hypothetical protein
MAAVMFSENAQLFRCATFRPQGRGSICLMKSMGVHWVRPSVPLASAPVQFANRDTHPGRALDPERREHHVDAIVGQRQILCPVGHVWPSTQRLRRRQKLPARDSGTPATLTTRRPGPARQPADRAAVGRADPPVVTQAAGLAVVRS